MTSTGRVRGQDLRGGNASTTMISHKEKHYNTLCCVAQSLVIHADAEPFIPMTEVSKFRSAESAKAPRFQAPCITQGFN